MGISFQSRHYFLGGSATAPRFNPIVAVAQNQGDSYFLGYLCLFWGDLNALRRSEMRVSCE